mgnify:CR=1 FL=1
MKLRYPYVAKTSSSFGIIPTAAFWLYIYSPKGYLPLSFLFDTGSDVTSLPASVAQKLGVNLANCPKEVMSGYEGSEVEVYKSQIRINFGDKNFLIPCVFNLNPNAPTILGRAGIFNKFIIVLDGKNKEITFEEI